MILTVIETLCVLALLLNHINNNNINNNDDGDGDDVDISAELAKVGATLNSINPNSLQKLVDADRKVVRDPSVGNNAGNFQPRTELEARILKQEAEKNQKKK
eukprot:c2322_g1_i1.p2 GENE.c2322_g1_i1~~c2322_g1_i1.p2  ORF type:complete len:102 (+),score=1.08 c2322_g1_i1:652-957(+)